MKKRKTIREADVGTTQASQSVVPPRISMLKHPKQLVLQTLLPGYVWVIPSFLTINECNEWIRFFESQSTRHVTVSHRGTREMASRKCTRWQDNNMCGVADDIYQRLSHCHALMTILSALGGGGGGERRPASCNPNLRIYKYVAGQSFGRHVDESNPVGRDGITLVTVLIYLSTCTGGATQFFYPSSSLAHKNNRMHSNHSDDVIEFAPQPGAMLLHLHGDDCLLHQGDAVIKGTKYVLRTDVVYRTER